VHQHRVCLPWCRGGRIASPSACAIGGMAVSGSGCREGGGGGPAAG
jgi:hypothetical protein